MNDALFVGFGRADVTPEGSVPMAGAPGNSRMSVDNMTSLYAISIAFRDSEGNTALVITVDNAFVGETVCTQCRNRLSEALGISSAAICICSTHTHSSPSAAEMPYREFLEAGIIKSGLAAVEDLAPAEMYASVVKTQNMNFVRNYVMKDGSYAGVGWGDYSIGFAGHESDADPDLQLVKFVRNGKKDILMANFSAHPHREYNKPENYYKIGANAPYIFRKELEEKLSCHVAYFSGASGNVNLNSKIKEENVAHDYIQHGKMLANYALAGQDHFVQIPGVRVSFRVGGCMCTVNHSEDSLADVARKIRANYEVTADKKAADEECKAAGMYNRLHAAAIVRKSELPEQIEMPIQGICVGELAFACVPGEPYDTLGKLMKQKSGCKMTFVLTLCNWSGSYLPSFESFQHGGYGAYACSYVAGTGEKIANEVAQMLNEMREGKQC